MARDSSRGVDPVDATLEELTQVAEALVDRLTFEDVTGPEAEEEAPAEEDTLEIVVSTDADPNDPVLLDAEETSEPATPATAVVAEPAAEAPAPHDVASSELGPGTDIDDHLDSLFGGAADTRQVVSPAVQPPPVSDQVTGVEVRTEVPTEIHAEHLPETAVTESPGLEIEAAETTPDDEATSDEPAAILQMDGSYVTTGVADEAQELCETAAAVAETPEPREPTPYVPYEVNHGPTAFWPVAAVAAVILLGGGIWLARSLGWMNARPAPEAVRLATPKPSPAPAAIEPNSGAVLESSKQNLPSEISEAGEPTGSTNEVAQPNPSQASPVQPSEPQPTVARARATPPVEAPKTVVRNEVPEPAPARAQPPLPSRSNEPARATAPQERSTVQVTQRAVERPAPPEPEPVQSQRPAPSIPPTQVGKAVRLAVPVRRSSPAAPVTTTEADSTATPSPTPAASPVPDRPAEALQRVEPTLAPQVRVKDGEVPIELSVLVDDQGNVIRVVVEDGAGRPDLESAAIDAMLRWKFRPATENGTSVRSWITHTFRFGTER